MRRFAFSIMMLMFAVPLRAQEAPEKTRNPEKNFEFLWQAFDRSYCNFGAKHIDWDLVYKVYRPRVTATTTDDELFGILSDVIGLLNDNHVGLLRGVTRFRSGILQGTKVEDFSLDVVKEKYLKGKFEARGGNWEFGFIGDSIGYLHFKAFRDRKASAEVIDEIIEAFKDCKGVIVDVRGNGGGDDMVGKAIADRFSDGPKRLYMVTRMRTGPGHEDFALPKEFYVEPEGPKQFTRPVILLTHRHSVSAAENFTLAMRRLPHVTVVGDLTSGAFADVNSRMMPNGWRVSVPYNFFVDHEGFCWEGLGLAPHMRIVNSPEDIKAGRDRVLDLALSIQNSGAIKSREGMEKYIWPLKTVEDGARAKP